MENEKFEVILTMQEIEYLVNSLNYFLKGQNNAIGESQNVLHIVKLLQNGKKVEKPQAKELKAEKVEG